MGAIPLVFLALAAGLPDRGIYPELEPTVQLALPPAIDDARTWVRIDPTHGIVTLFEGEHPRKAYPARVPAGLRATSRAELGLATLEAPAPDQVRLRGDDLAELSPHLPAGARVVVGRPPRGEDRDGDGIVDRLDVLLGAKKLLANKAEYIERYVGLRYPGGDVPRTEGVCTDTVIRSLRNAGLDLQKEVHEDIARAPRAYPMVEKVDASINHRRVKTILPWFKRHFTELPKGTPYQPGDVVFFDTFPSKAGPDHLGVVSDRRTREGLPLVINNWTVGSVDAEMELLSWVPVTHHFRMGDPLRPAR
jgi:hypothetical protein